LNEQQVGQYMQAQGYDGDTATLLYREYVDKLQGEFSYQLATKALNEYAHGHLTVEALNAYINVDTLNILQKDHLVKMSQFVTNTPQTKLSLQQGVQMVEKGIWTISQFRDLA